MAYNKAYTSNPSVIRAWYQFGSEFRSKTFARLSSVVKARNIFRTLTFFVWTRDKKWLEIEVRENKASACSVNYKLNVYDIVEINFRSPPLFLM